MACHQSLSVRSRFHLLSSSQTRYKSCIIVLSKRLRLTPLGSFCLCPALFRLNHKGLRGIKGDRPCTHPFKQPFPRPFSPSPWVVSRGPRAKLVDISRPSPRTPFTISALTICIFGCFGCFLAFAFAQPRRAR